MNSAAVNSLLTYLDTLLSEGLRRFSEELTLYMLEVRAGRPDKWLEGLGILCKAPNSIWQCTSLKRRLAGDVQSSNSVWSDVW